MKKLLLTSVAALFLATGAAHANEHKDVRCAGRLFNIFGHHGYTFSQYDKNGSLKELPKRLFFQDKDYNWFYRGHKCEVVKDYMASYGEGQ